MNVLVLDNCRYTQFSGFSKISLICCISHMFKILSIFVIPNILWFAFINNLDMLSDEIVCLYSVRRALIIMLKKKKQ